MKAAMCVSGGTQQLLSCIQQHLRAIRDTEEVKTEH